MHVIATPSTLGILAGDGGSAGVDSGDVVSQFLHHDGGNHFAEPDDLGRDLFEMLEREIGGKWVAPRPRGGVGELKNHRARREEEKRNPEYLWGGNWAGLPPE